MTETNEYRCSGECGKIKNETEFHLTSRKYGNHTYKYRHAKCKVCRNKQRRDYYKEAKK